MTAEIEKGTERKTAIGIENEIVTEDVEAVLTTEEINAIAVIVMTVVIGVIEEIALVTKSALAKGNAPGTEKRTLSVKRNLKRRLRKRGRRKLHSILREKLSCLLSAKR
jgi:hypothetical protein